MKRILVTGATGNVGSEVIHDLIESNSEIEIIAAVRNVDRAKETFRSAPNLSFRHFDFENFETFKTAFKGIDILFLLRPPHISQVQKIFRPLLESAKENYIKNVVFLSVQGAEKSKVIPHNKIERLIIQLNFNYIFVRPSYFMQNITTSLLKEIVDKKTITLPSRNAKFNWIDIRNIGKASAILLIEFEKFQNKSYELTGTENKNFSELTTLMSELTGVNISYRSVNPFRFYFMKRSEGIESAFAFVMTMLHFLPRIQNEPVISDNYRRLTGEDPSTLKEFIDREKERLTTSLPHK